MSETTAMEPRRTQLAPRPTLTAAVIQSESEQRALLMQFIDTQMVLDTDYGIIPGTTKRTLLKPGAEKLTNLFRCAPRFTITDKVENWEEGLFHYQFKCEIESIESGLVVAEGFGSCSTRESKYWNRNEDRKCPSCGKPTVRKSKKRETDPHDSIPGWYCWGKIGGCGEQFVHNDPLIVDQVVGKVKNPDIYDNVNTVLKMSKKRSHVDAAFALARCSDLFEAEEFADVIAESARKNEKYDHAETAKPATTQSTTQTETKQTTKAETKKTETKKPATRYEKLVDFWQKANFPYTDLKGNAGEQLLETLTKLHEGNLKANFSPINPDDETNVVEYVMREIEMGQDAEWKDLSNDAVKLAGKAVLAWLKLCPTEPAK